MVKQYKKLLMPLSTKCACYEVKKAKSIVPSFLILFFLLGLNSGWGQTLIAGWDFQTTTNGGTATAAATSTPRAYVANVGSGNMYLDNTNFSSNWLQATELSAFGGSALNAGGTTGLSTTTSGASSLALLGGTSNSANGKSIVLKFSMTGKQNLIVSYATQKTATGFATQTWEYSTNGTTWSSAGSITSVPTSFAVQTLATITGLDNAATAYLRLTVTGATAASGNNRIDNIQLNASTLSASPTIVLADNGTQVIAANVDRGTQNVILNKIQLGVSVADANLTGMTCTTVGSYLASDVSNLRVRYSADATLDASTVTDPILSTLASPGTAGSKTFTSFTSKTITNGTTGYIFITADVSATATHNNTISVNAIGSGNLTIGGTPTYSPAVATTAGGAQTFKDVTAPTVTTLTPLNGATLVALASNLVITFSENVKAGSGAINIYDSSNVLFESYASEASQITYSGSTVTINPVNNLAYGKTYYVTISPGAITDTQDVAFAGFSSNTDWSFTTLDEPPFNNACSTATALSLGTTNSAGTFFGATADYGPSRDVWYSFTPTCSGTHTITVNFVGGGNANADFEVYATTCPTSTTGRLQLYNTLDAVFTNIANSTSGSDEIAELQTAVAGTTYYIRVIDPSDETATFDITVSTTVTPSIALSNTGTPVAGNVGAGSNSVVLYGFSLTPSACNASFSFTAANIATSGTADSGDLSNFRLIVDSANFGVADAGEISAAIGSAAFTNGNALSFSSLGQTLTGNTATRYLLIADVNSVAANGRTFTASLANTDVTASQTVTGSAAGNQQNITATSITIADNGTQTGSGNILRGTNNTVVSKAKLTVGGQTASVSQIQFVTAGSSSAYVQADIATNGFKLWRSVSSSSLNTNTDTLLGSVSSSKGATATNNDTLTFPVSESLPIGDYYYWLTVDVASTATPTHTITVNGLSNASVTSAGTTITGTTSSAGTQTIISPMLTIADNTQVTAQSVFVGSTANVISKAQFTPSVTNVNVTGIDFVTSGTYASSDIAANGFKLWVTTSNTFATTTAFGTTNSSVTGNGETVSFTDNQTLTSGTTYYFWLTADVSASATLGHTIVVNGLSGSSVASNTIGLFKAGTTSTTGAQTFIDNAPSLSTTPASVDAPFSITLSPDNSGYRGAITSVKIGATSLAFTTSAGNITLDPANASNTLLRTVGSKTIDITATNYTAAQVTQVMLVGATAKLAVTTALAAPTTNGGLFATQPVLSYRDKYDNPTTSTETVRATKLDAGSWTLGGTTDITPSSASSSAAFTNLTATSAAAVSNAQIRFSLPNVPGSSTVDSATFTLIAPDFISITALGVAATENFDGMGSSGTAALPTGFKAGAASPTFATGTSAATLAYGTTGTGIITGTSGGGVINWANGATASSTDRALGFITTGSFTSPRSIMAKFKNVTGSTINALSIQFDYEKYRSGSRIFDWTFFQSNDGSTWTPVTAGDQNYPADANNTVVSNPPLTTATKNVSLTGLTLTNGSIIYLRWAYTGNGGSTNGQGLAIDNFSITGTACATVAASVSAVSSPICSGSTASFTLNGTAGTVISYTLNGNSGNATVLAGGSVTVTTAAVTTNQTLTLTSASLSGCSNAVSGSATVVVNPYPVPDSIPDVTQCGGTFTLPALNVGTYYTGSGATGSVLAAGTVISSSQTIYVYASNAPSCSAEDPFTITINQLPIVTASDVSGCSGSPINLIGSGTPSGGSGNFSVANPYVGTTSTTYTYTYTSPLNGCTVTSAPANITITAQPQWYLDADGDHYYTGTAVSSCTSPGTGYTTSGLLGGGDCADNDAAINPGATEICYNNIDDNCNTTLSEGCAPVVVNMTASYNNTTLASLSTAIPAVTYSYAPYTNLKYRFSITNVTTGAAPVEITQASRYVTIPASLHLYGAAYDIKVSAVINEEVVPYAGNTIRVNAPTVQLITLSSGNCGATLASLTSTLSANPGLNATGYTFRIRLNDANPSPTYAFSQSGTRFINANSFTGFPLQYSSSYKVSVQYTFIDPVTTLTVESGYGAECIVNTPGMPLINIASPTCGSQVSAMNANIASGVAAYSTSYQFRIRLFNDNGPTPTYYYTIPNASRFSSLAAFQGITLAYNTAYSISVQYSVLNGSTTVWSGYGPDCKVTTPFFPVTSLVPSQCGLTASTPLTQQLNITPYPGFPHYMVKLEEVSGETVLNSQEIEIAYSYFRLNQFSIAQEGKNYAVSVKIKLNGVFGDYDTACDLHTPQPNEGGNNGGGTIVKALLPFKATAYPNPFANNFMLDVRTSSQSNMTLKVYDMIGRLIEQRVVTVSDMGTATIGDQYPTGVYNIVLSQEDSTETLRVVKR